MQSKIDDMNKNISELDTGMANNMTNIENNLTVIASNTNALKEKDRERDEERRESARLSSTHLRNDTMLSHRSMSSLTSVGSVGNLDELTQALAVLPKIEEYLASHRPYGFDRRDTQFTQNTDTQISQLTDYDSLHPIDEPSFNDETMSNYSYNTDFPDETMSAAVSPRHTPITNPTSPHLGAQLNSFSGAAGGRVQPHFQLQHQQNHQQNQQQNQQQQQFPPSIDIWSFGDNGEDFGDTPNNKLQLPSNNISDSRFNNDKTC